MTHHYLPESLPSDSGMFDPDGKGWEKTLPGSDHQRRAPLSHEDRSLSRFPSRDGEESLNDVFAGLLRVFWLEDKGAKSRGPVTRMEFFGWPSERLARVAVKSPAERP